MERSKEQLLELTQCGLWGNEPRISLFDGGVNWGIVLRLAKEQTLLGVVSTAIEMLPSSLRPSREKSLRLHQMVTLNRAFRRHQIEVLGRLLELLRGIGVERPVLLKGLGVGLNYPDPTLRQCGDIDLYVGERYYDEVWDFICDKFGVTKESNHSPCHFDFDFMDTHIEIHKYATAPNSVAFRRGEFMAWSREQLEGEQVRLVSIEGVETYLPPYNFDFIYIFYHMWRHFLTGGVGLRQLCDWSCYISTFSEKIDRKEVRRLISLFRLDRPISLFATIAVESLGVSPNHLLGVASTSESKYQRVLDRIWSGGNFGFYREINKIHVETILERKWRSFNGQLQDMIFLFSIDWIYSLKFYPTVFAKSIQIAIKHRKELGNKL